MEKRLINQKVKADRSKLRDVVILKGYSQNGAKIYKLYIGLDRPIECYFEFFEDLYFVLRKLCPRGYEKRKITRVLEKDGQQFVSLNLEVL